MSPRASVSPQGYKARNITLILEKPRASFVDSKGIK